MTHTDVSMMIRMGVARDSKIVMGVTGISMIVMGVTGISMGMMGVASISMIATGLMSNSVILKGVTKGGKIGISMVIEIATKMKEITEKEKDSNIERAVEKGMNVE
jgi:hypothetical protein